MSEDTADLKSFLGGIAIFGGLEGPSLDRVIERFEEVRLPAGTTICREGDTGRSLYIVRSGKVLVSRQSKAGHLIRIAHLGTGEFFGEMTLIDVQPRSATVMAEEKSLLYALTNKDLYHLYRDDVHAYVMILQNICRELSRRLRLSDSRICAIAEDEDVTTVGEQRATTSVVRALGHK